MKIIHRLFLSLTLFFSSFGVQAQAIDFAQNKSSAGKASLTSSAYYVQNVLGVANFSQEMRMPVQIFYDSSNTKKGMLGVGWNIPQLESSAFAENGGMIWTAPWGEQIQMCERGRLDAKALAMLNEQEKENGYFSPYGDWTANGGKDGGSWVIFGRNEMAGWKFTYVDARLRDVTSPSGDVLMFYYNGKRLTSVEQKSTAFISLKYSENALSEISINGVAHSFKFREGALRILPETLAGKEKILKTPFLASVAVEGNNPLEFEYDAAGHLVLVKRGDYEDKIAVETENEAQRKDYLRKIADAKKANKKFVQPKIDGRILSDTNYKYLHLSDKPGNVELTNKLGQKATYAYDSSTGVMKRTDFSGDEKTFYYFMRYDVAYNGKLRQVVDGQGRVLASYRYDKDLGKPTRVRDIAKNDINLTYDKSGNLSSVSKRGADEEKPLPVATFTYAGKSKKPGKINYLDESGNIVRTTSIIYNSDLRPVSVDDGRLVRNISYSIYGYPKHVGDSLNGITVFNYDRYNRVVSKEFPNGVKMHFAYDKAGRLVKRHSTFEKETLSSLAIAYDKNGNPVSFTDQEGLTKAYERDSHGRILKEVFPDETEVEYAYNEIGKLLNVRDQNGNEIGFTWNRHGLDSRITAVGQITQNAYDKFGKLTSVESKFTGKKADKKISYKHDKFDRISEIIYGEGQVETIKYDTWGRITEQSKGGLKSEFKYDHFGRLIEKREGDSISSYAYDSYGKRILRISKVGDDVFDEQNKFDKYGRLVKTYSNGKTVEYKYDDKNRLSEQIVDGVKIAYTYDKLGRLERKAMLDEDGKNASELKYFYSKSGKIIARLANERLQSYKYDTKDQLLAVIDAESGSALEEYTYDPAGNILKKTAGGKTTEYKYDATNQLVSSTTDGVETKYEYDAAGRLIQEGAKTYNYGWLDKVMSVAENGNVTANFEYHNNGQLAKANRGENVESFVWDGLALIGRNGNKFVNEPHAGGGNPIINNDKILFNDVLGTTLGEFGQTGYSAVDKTSFGADSTETNSFFTGKPYVEDLGYTFLFRNYRSDIGKWQTQDPIGYPDGWNNLAYCNNNVVLYIDLLGAAAYINLTGKTSASNVYIRNESKPMGVVINGNVGNVESSSNYNVLISHGTESLGTNGHVIPELSGYVRDKKENSLMPSEVAEMLKNSPGYDPNLPVLMTTCHAGLWYADELAKLLGNTVIAPDGLGMINTTSDGKKYIEMHNMKPHE